MCINTKKEQRQVERKHFMDVVIFFFQCMDLLFMVDITEDQYSLQNSLSICSMLLKLVMISWNGEKSVCSRTPRSSSLPGDQVTLPQVRG